MVLPLLFGGLAQRVNLDFWLLVGAIALLRAKGQSARARPLVARALLGGGLHCLRWGEKVSGRGKGPRELGTRRATVRRCDGSNRRRAAILRGPELFGGEFVKMASKAWKGRQKGRAGAREAWVFRRRAAWRAEECPGGWWLGRLGSSRFCWRAASLSRDADQSIIGLC